MKGPLPTLHAVTDDRIARRPDLDQIAAELAAGGGSALAFHARGRSLSGLEHYELANRLAACLPTRLFVNDRLDIALTVTTHGVQLSQGSLPVAAARNANDDWWIGRSVHSRAEAESALAEGADYLLVGPVFATATHPDRPALGLAVLQEIVRLGLPVVAIGGVTAERAREVRQSGAHGVAAIRAFWDAVEPAAAVRQMLVEWMR